jgi:WD40 repeat protein
VWDLATRQADLVIATQPVGGIDAVDVSPDGDLVAAGGYKLDTGQIFLAAWDPTTGRRIFSVPRPGGDQISDIAFSPDGSHLAIARWDGIVRIIDRTGMQVSAFRVGIPGRPVPNARFSPDGRRVAVVASDPHGRERVQLWDWRTQHVVRTIEAGEFLDFDPTGARIVTADRQGRGEIVDVNSGAVVAVLAVEPGTVLEATFSPDGTSIATAGTNGAVHLLDAATGAERLTLPSVRCAVTDVAFSHDGTKLASASSCDGVRVWALDIDDLLRIARQSVTRSLTEQECREYLHKDRCP